MITILSNSEINMISPEEIAHHYISIQRNHRNDEQFGDQIGMDATFVFLTPHVSSWIESYLLVQEKKNNAKHQEQAINQLEYVYFVYSQLPLPLRCIFIELIIPRLKQEFFNSYTVWERQSSAEASQHAQRVPESLWRIAQTLGLF